MCWLDLRRLSGQKDYKVSIEKSVEELLEIIDKAGGTDI